MPGPRRSPASAGLRPRLPMLAGIVVALLVAGGGTAAYLLAGQPRSAAARPLPSRAVSIRSVSLVAAASAATGPPELLHLVSGPAAPEFSPLSQDQVAVGSPQWTADLMGKGSYIFIFLATGRCLTTTGMAAQPKLALDHCDLGAPQRFRRRGSPTTTSGHEFYQYVSYRGSCLTVTGQQPDGNYGAELAPCATPAPASQLIALW